VIETSINLKKDTHGGIVAVEHALLVRGRGVIAPQRRRLRRDRPEREFREVGWGALVGARCTGRLGRCERSLLAYDDNGGGEKGREKSSHLFFFFGRWFGRRGRRGRRYVLMMG
jgi:hypothetical protein